MQRLQAFQYALMPPSGQQQRQMRRFAGTCRLVFNEALGLQKKRYDSGEKKLNYAGLCKQLTAWRNGAVLPSGRVAPWLAEAPVHPLQQTLKDLERAYANFFAKRAAFPKFKKKGQHESFRYPDPKQIKLDQANSRIFLPKLGWLRYRNSRAVLGEVKNVTVRLKAGRWWVSIQTEREVAQPVPIATSAIGIDMGIVRFATMSDGSFVAPLDSFRKHEIRLARYQRAMSRKRKGGKNWHKAKAKVQRIHARIANCRKDFLHKATAAISKNHALVCIEDLQVRNMSKSAAGNVEQPGKQVKAKAGLNKAILDQGWFEFRRQLEYKLQWAGGMLVAVDPRNTSRACPECNQVHADNRKSQAQFVCMQCGFEEHADVVGALNILARGMEKLRDEGRDTTHGCVGCASTARLACGGDVSRAASAKTKRAAPVKQEPAEATHCGLMPQWAP